MKAKPVPHPNALSKGTIWTGKVWYVYEMKKFEFDLKFDIPVSVRSKCHVSATIDYL